MIFRTTLAKAFKNSKVRFIYLEMAKGGLLELDIKTTCAAQTLSCRHSSRKLLLLLLDYFICDVGLTFRQVLFFPTEIEGCL